MQQVYDYGTGQVVGLQPNYQAMVDAGRSKAGNMTSGYKTVNLGLAENFAEQLKNHQNQVNSNNVVNLQNIAQRGGNVSSSPIYQNMVDTNNMRTVTNGRPSARLASDIVAAQDAYFAEPATPNTVAAVSNTVATKPSTSAAKRVAVGNPEVVDLQKQLNSQGYNLKVDGINGPKTQAAYFESRNKSDPEVTDYMSGNRPAYVPGKLEEVNMTPVATSQANRGYNQGLEDSTKAWLANELPEGAVPTASYNYGLAEALSRLFK